MSDTATGCSKASPTTCVDQPTHTRQSHCMHSRHAQRKSKQKTGCAAAHPLSDDAFDQRGGRHIKGRVPHANLSSHALALEVGDLQGRGGGVGGSWTESKQTKMRCMGWGKRAGGSARRTEGQRSTAAGPSAPHPPPPLPAPQWGSEYRCPAAGHNEDCSQGAMSSQGRAPLPTLKRRARSSACACQIFGTATPLAPRQAGWGCRSPRQAGQAEPGPQHSQLACGSIVVVGAATKKGMSWWCAATAWQKVPILLAAAGGTEARGRGSGAAITACRP